MPSNNMGLNHERERTQRYAHRGAAGSPDYHMTRNGYDRRGDPLDLPNGDTFQRHEATTEEPLTSRGERRPGYETPFPNSGPTNDQFDGCFESDDIFQQPYFSHPDRGEDDRRRSYYDARPKPQRGNLIHCTHSEHEPRMRYLGYLSRDKSPSKEEMRHIGKEKKWPRSYHGRHDAELPGLNGRRYEQCDPWKVKYPSKRGYFSTFHIYKGDEVFTGPSSRPTRRDWISDLKGSNFNQRYDFPDSSSHAHPPSRGNISWQQLIQDYCRLFPNRKSGSLRGGHGDDAEDQSSSSAHYQATVEDIPDSDAYLADAEQGESSQAATNRQQSSGEGLSRIRAIHATSRAEDEEAAVRLKKYLEVSHQEKQTLHEAKAIERILRQERVDLERRCAERVTKEIHPQTEQAEMQPHKNRRHKGKEPATTSGSTHRPDEASIQHKVAEHPQASDFPYANHGDRPNTVREVYGHIVLQPLEACQLREAERAQLEARARATSQAAYEAYLGLFPHDHVDEEAAMHCHFPFPEEMMPGGQAHRTPVNRAPVNRTLVHPRPVNPRPVFLPGSPRLPRPLTVDARTYGRQVANSTLGHGRRSSLQPNQFSETGRLIGPRARPPYPYLNPPLTHHLNKDWDYPWDDELDSSDDELEP